MTEPTFVPTGPAPGDERRRLPLGQLVFGLVLVAIGAGWLITALDLFEVPWRGVMAVALIIVGVALIATSTLERHSGLLVVGVILTVALALASSAEGLLDVPLRGGIGERLYDPSSFSEVTEEYRLAIGELRVDLDDVSFPAGETRITATVTFGQLVVRLPDDVVVRIEGRVTGGQLTMLGRTFEGVGIDETFVEGGYDVAERRLFLEVGAGFGEVEVRR